MIIYRRYFLVPLLSGLVIEFLFKYFGKLISLNFQYCVNSSEKKIRILKYIVDWVSVLHIFCIWSSWLELIVKWFTEHPGSLIFQWFWDKMNNHPTKMCSKQLINHEERCDACGNPKNYDNEKLKAVWLMILMKIFLFYVK